MMYYYGDFMGHPFFGGLFGILLWTVFIIFIVWMVRSMWRHGDTCEHTQKNSALDILKERYAKGEVGKEEYDQKKKDLSE